MKKKSSLYIMMILIWMAHLLVDVMLGIWPVYKSLIQFDLAQAGLIVALGAFLGEGSQLLFGSLSDKGYRKALIGIGLMLAMSAAFLPYFSDYRFLFLLYLLTCIGSGAFHPSAAGLMNTLIPEKRSLLMTIFASGGSVGLAFSQIIFTGLYTAMPGQSYLLAIPAIFLLIALLFCSFPESQVKNSPSRGIHVSDFISFFKRSDLRSLYITLVVNQTLLWGVIFILPDVLKALDHIEWVCYGGGHLCLIFGGAIMMVPAGHIADKYSARHVILTGNIISILMFYILLIFGHLSTLFALLSLFLLGACLVSIQPIGVALGGKLVPDKPSRISAFLMGMVWCVSEVLGPGSVGIMSSFFQDQAPVKALAILGLFFFVGIYASWCLPKQSQALYQTQQC